MVFKYTARYVFSLLFAALTLFAGNVLAQDGEDTAQQEGGVALSTDAGVITAGKQIFDDNCEQCHSVMAKKVGPALKNIYTRRDLPWIINFVKGPQKVIESGDPYAVKLFAEYKSAGYMTNHDFLSDEEIASVISYVQDHTNDPTKYETTVVTTGGGEEKEDISGLLIAVIAALGGLLLLVLIAMGVLVSVLNRSLKKTDGLSEDDQEALDTQVINLKKILSNGTVQTLVGFVFFAIIAKASLVGLFTVGVQQGYAPDQPIPFSHKLHAGYYEIDCKYCHTGALRGKSAGIPSANICMNCHNTIKTASPNIQKIYAAIEKDEPIQWVRVHNLPDLAYFNHSQHVTVAGIECQTCHGDIENMEVVQQFSKLTMGWCIACHRKTDVNTKGNAYYDNLVELHAEKSKEPLKVEDIGGLECSKCHY